MRVVVPLVLQVSAWRRRFTHRVSKSGYCVLLRLMLVMIEVRACALMRSSNDEPFL